MTSYLKATAMAATCVVAFCADVTPDAVLGFRFLSDANAVVGAPVTPGSVAGVARRTTRRTVAVASTTTATTSSAQAATTHSRTHSSSPPRLPSNLRQPSSSQRRHSNRPPSRHNRPQQPARHWPLGRSSQRCPRAARR